MNYYHILIVDDQPIVRYGLCALLSTEPDMKVVGETNSGQEAITLASELKPDVILMDIEMPGINGIEATKQIIAKNPEMNILIITFHEDDYVRIALQAGARGYLLKDAQPEEVMQAIRMVCDGKSFISHTIMDQVLQSYRPTRPVSGTLSELSERELEVLKLVAQGYIYSVIAKNLGITQRTVRTHVYNIGQKLLGIEEFDEIKGRNKLIEFANRSGLK